VCESLASGGDVVVFGEPKSLGYKNPKEGVDTELMRTDCSSGQREVKPAHVGSLKEQEAYLLAAITSRHCFWHFGQGASRFIGFGLK
jgi:hypothetical protein